MSATFTYEETLTLSTVECCNCGLVFGVPERWQQARRNDHQLFYCPNGHCQSYQGKSDAEKLREQLDSATTTITHLRDQAEAAERQARAQKAVATKLRQRVQNGVCPCCNRTFANVGRHMATKHPGFEQTALCA